MVTARELTTDQMRVVSWLTTPGDQREPDTIEELAKELEVRPATILKWRSRKLDALAAEETRMKLLEHLPEIYEALARKAADGSPEHMELFLRVASGYGVPPTTPTACDEPTALICTEANANVNKGDYYA
jgi:DNA-binding MurR/RpiR family transcriptional regulator